MNTFHETRYYFFGEFFKRQNNYETKTIAIIDFLLSKNKKLVFLVDEITKLPGKWKRTMISCLKEFVEDLYSKNLYLIVLSTVTIFQVFGLLLMQIF